MKVRKVCVKKMKRLFYRIIFTIAMVITTVATYAAEGVEFKANIPLMVSVGEPFPVEFSLNAKPEGDSFSPPEFEGFDVIAGPRISNGTSIQVINGNISKSVNYTYTYVLMAQSAGNFTIGAAKVEVDDTPYRSKNVAVEVIQESQSSAQQQQSVGGGSSSNQQNGDSSASNRIAQDDVLMRLILSRNNVYQGEPIKAVVKLYTRVDIVNNSNLKLPTFNGFWAQDISSKQQQTPQRETYNGKIYNTHTIREYLLYPQQSGDLTIEPAEIDIVAQVVVQSRNMDPFFGGGHDFYNVQRHVESAATTVNVKRLPANKPSSFAGAVGKYTIKMIPPEASSIKANTASTFRIRVEGSGNLSFVQAPKLELPNSFELYNVRTTEALNNSASGTTGYKEFEYPFIARAEGDYTIPAVDFSYFDPSSNAYVSISTNPFSLAITPDDNSGGEAKIVNNGVSKVDIEMLGSDIRFIKLDKAQFSSVRNPLMLSWLYFAILGAVVVLYITLFVVLRRLINDSKNEALRRGKRASKVAVQRFKSAKASMDSGDERTFYKEMLRGLWGYMSDKLNIPVADLTKECVRDELTKRGGGEEITKAFSNIITRCDEAQYSPAASSEMDDVYGHGLQLVSQIEQLFKRKK